MAQKKFVDIFPWKISLVHIECNAFQNTNENLHRNRKSILKFKWNHQRPWIIEEIICKKNIPQAFKIHKKSCNCQKHGDHWDRTEKTNEIYSQLISFKCQDHTLGRMVISTDEEDNVLFVCWRMTLDSCSLPFTKINLMWVKVSDMWLWTVKLLKPWKCKMAQVWGQQSQKWTNGIYSTKNMLHR